MDSSLSARRVDEDIMTNITLRQKGENDNPRQSKLWALSVAPESWKVSFYSEGGWNRTPYPDDKGWVKYEEALAAGQIWVLDGTVPTREEALLLAQTQDFGEVYL